MPSRTRKVPIASFGPVFSVLNLFSLYALKDPFLMPENKNKQKMLSPQVSWFILNILITCFLSAAIAAFSIRTASQIRAERSSNRVRVLRLGHGLSTDHPVHQAMLYMAKRLRELSSGRMDVHDSFSPEMQELAQRIREVR